MKWDRLRATSYGAALTVAGAGVWGWLTSGYIDWPNMQYHFSPVDLRALGLGSLAVIQALATALWANLMGWGKPETQTTTKTVTVTEPVPDEVVPVKKVARKAGTK
jgi:hypothetical protein